MLGKIEGRRRRAQQSMRWLDGITDSMNMVLGELIYKQIRNRLVDLENKYMVKRGKKGEG